NFSQAFFTVFTLISSSKDICLRETPFISRSAITFLKSSVNVRLYLLFSLKLISICFTFLYVILRDSAIFSSLLPSLYISITFLSSLFIIYLQLYYYI